MSYRLQHKGSITHKVEVKQALDNTLFVLSLLVPTRYGLDHDQKYVGKTMNSVNIVEPADV